MDMMCNVTIWCNQSGAQKTCCVIANGGGGKGKLTIFVAV